MIITVIGEFQWVLTRDYFLKALFSLWVSCFEATFVVLLGWQRGKHASSDTQILKTNLYRSTV